MTDEARSIKAQIEALDQLAQAVRDARAAERLRILAALSRESHADSPHGDGFVETRGGE